MITLFDYGRLYDIELYRRIYDEAINKIVP
jgi:hypothetical protein